MHEIYATELLPYKYEDQKSRSDHKKGVYLRREWLTKDETEYLLSADTSSYLIDKMDLCSYVRPQPATMINMPQSAINAPSSHKESVSRHPQRAAKSTPCRHKRHHKPRKHAHSPQDATLTTRQTAPVKSPPEATARYWRFASTTTRAKSIQ